MRWCLVPASCNCVRFGQKPQRALRHGRRRPHSVCSAPATRTLPPPSYPTPIFACGRVSSRPLGREGGPPDAGSRRDRGTRPTAQTGHRRGEPPARLSGVVRRAAPRGGGPPGTTAVTKFSSLTVASYGLRPAAKLAAGPFRLAGQTAHPPPRRTRSAREYGWWPPVRRATGGAPLAVAPVLPTSTSRPLPPPCCAPTGLAPAASPRNTLAAAPPARALRAADGAHARACRRRPAVGRPGRGDAADVHGACGAGRGPAAVGLHGAAGLVRRLPRRHRDQLQQLPLRRLHLLLPVAADGCGRAADAQRDGAAHDCARCRRRRRVQR